VEYKNLSEMHRAKIREASSEHAWSFAYGMLALAMILATAILVMMNKWPYAIAIWILSNISLTIGQIKHTKSHRVLDEQ
jgi:hypothetical protein